MLCLFFGLVLFLLLLEAWNKVKSVLSNMAFSFLLHFHRAHSRSSIFCCLSLQLVNFCPVQKVGTVTTYRFASFKFGHVLLCLHLGCWHVLAKLIQTIKNKIFHLDILDNCFVFLRAFNIHFRWKFSENLLLFLYHFDLFCCLYFGNNFWMLVEHFRPTYFQTFLSILRLSAEVIMTNGLT